MSQYEDLDLSHDHTYYGYGCDNAWSGNTPPYGGSDVSCSINRIQTSDGETQSIGNYSNFQAATSGSGAAITTENANSPDTFCPLGWQMPYGGTGGDYYDKSKSWNYLINAYGYDINIDAPKIKSYPVSLINSGHFYNGVWLFRANNAGVIWSSAVRNNGTSVYRIWVAAGSILTNDGDGKRTMNPLRCVTRY